MKQLGDAYVRSEFKLHKSATNAHHIDQFMSEWRNYLEHIQSTANEKKAGDAKFGRSLSLDVEKLDQEKQMTLAKLKEEAFQAGRGKN